MSLGKTELIKAVSVASGESVAAVKRVVDALEDVVIHDLKTPGKVALTGFVTFESKAKAATTKRNPANGQQVQVPAHVSVSVKAGKTLKDSIR